MGSLLLRTAIFVIDNFYSNPKTLIKKARSLKFSEPEDLVGWRTNKGMLPENIIELIFVKSGLVVKSIQRPQGTPYDNGTVFMSFSSGTKKERPGIHWDLPLNEMLCLVYLSENIPLECGTSFYQHRKTGLESAPTAKDAKRLNQSKSELEVIIQRDRFINNRFIETERIGYKFNRAIIFPSRRLHAASKHFGKDIESGRIFQAFSFKVK